jgi:hypothetical protein
VAAGANQYAIGSAAGDAVFRTAAGKLLLDTNNGAGTPSVIIAGANGAVTINNGVGANGSGVKHARLAGCTTAAVAGATCNVTLTWTTAFADANYTAVCGIDGSSGPAAMVGIFNKLAASIQVGITAVTAVAATATNFDCIAVHD